MLMPPTNLRGAIKRELSRGKPETLPDRLTKLTLIFMEKAILASASRSLEIADHARKVERNWIYSAIVTGKVHGLRPSEVMSKIQAACDPVGNIRESTNV